MTFFWPNRNSFVSPFAVFLECSFNCRCLESGQLFVDPIFPPCESSLYITRSAANIQWLRASEIIDDPQFFVGGGTRFDINQGELGDCWLLAAIANLTMHQELFEKVVPHDQSFDDYAGTVFGNHRKVSFYIASYIYILRVDKSWLKVPKIVH